jgi:DnaJ-class molecular chaperone
MQCPECKGTGSIVEMGQVKPCLRCDGTGIVPDPKPVRVWWPGSMRRPKAKPSGLRHTRNLRRL